MARGATISNDLIAVITRLLNIFDITYISALTGVSIRKIKSIKSQLQQNGSVILRVPKKHRYPRRLGLSETNYLLGSLAHTPDLSLNELHRGLLQHHGIDVSNSTIWRALRASGMTMKKPSKVAAERSPFKRASYMMRIGMYQPEQLVFIDESAVDRRTTYRNKAWSVRGQRAFRKTQFVRGKRYSILPGLSLDGILAVRIVEGSFTSASFGVFIKHLLDNMNCFPGRNSVIVMDNCRIHKHPEVLQEIIDRYEFLPPYSPDFNPIEEAFAVVKSYIRRHGTEMRVAMNGDDDLQAYKVLFEAVWSITSTQAAGFYSGSSYL